MSEQNVLPQLTSEEIRVLGALIEKSKTTPNVPISPRSYFRPLMDRSRCIRIDTDMH